MEYIVTFLAGAAAAASGLVIWYFAYVALLRKEKQAVRLQEERLMTASANLDQRATVLENWKQNEVKVLETWRATQISEIETRKQAEIKALEARRAKELSELETRKQAEIKALETRTAKELSELETRRRNETSALEKWKRETQATIAVKNADVQNRTRSLTEAIAAFEARKVQYDALVRENGALKQDLFSQSVQVKKMERDQAAIVRRQKEIVQRTNDVGDRYLEENVAWIGAKLTTKNFSSCRDRLVKVIEACRGIGHEVPAAKEQKLVEDLRTTFEAAVRQEFAREEQARIKAQVREEERLAREVEKQKQDAEKQKQNAERAEASIQAAVAKALKEGKDEQSAEIQYLKAQLKEAEEAAQRAEEARQRAISRAQTTKSGHVYVLSNIGSFGDGVFKIGMTRREEPQDRVKELGDASVPFPFDVHMMLSCNDAPALENALHRELHKQRLNKVNFRKEYFRTDIEAIRQVVEAHHGQVDYVAEPAALEYRESTTMPDQDYEFVEQTVQKVIEKEGTSFVED